MIGKQMGSNKLLDLFKASFFSEMKQYEPRIVDKEILNEGEADRSIGVFAEIVIQGVSIVCYFSMQYEDGEVMVFINENADTSPLSKELFLEFFLHQSVLDKIENQ